MLTRRQAALALAGAAASIAMTGRAVAQPTDKTLRLLVGFAAGGAADTVARLIGAAMRSAGYNVIVENRVGAGGRIASDALQNLPADGSTLVLTPSSNLTLYPHIYKQLRYTLKDFAPIASVCEFGFGFAVGAGSEAKTLQQFLAAAKADPAKGAFGSPGVGTIMHFLGSMLSQQSHVPLTHVPYKGGSAVLTDIVGGTIPSLITTVPNLLPLQLDGKLRILVVSSAAPIAALPNVPTFAAAGFPDLMVSEYFLLMARSGTSAAALAQLSVAIRDAVATPEVAASLRKLEYEPRYVDASGLSKRLAADEQRWSMVVPASGYKPESA